MRRKSQAVPDFKKKNAESKDRREIAVLENNEKVQELLPRVERRRLNSKKKLRIAKQAKNVRVGLRKATAKNAKNERNPIKLKRGQTVKSRLKQLKG